MTDFGWMRLAYLLVVLSVLGALVQLETPSANPRPLAAEPPGEGTEAGEPRGHEGAPPRQSPATPAFARHLQRAAVAGRGAVGPGSGPAVFYRPPPEKQAGPAPEPGAAARSGPVCGDLGRFPGGHRLVFPLPMRYVNSYEDTWGAPRPQGGHEGTDLMSPTGTPEYAVTDGTVVPVIGSNGNGWNTLGGYTVMLRAAYSVGPVREGDLFYYAHLDRESALPLGTRVRAGQVVGYAGDTGQGPPVTRGLFPPHLHFGWYDATGTRSYLPSGAMNPYPLLEWIGAGGGVLGGGSKARYCEVPRSGAPTPSKGPDRWPAARDAGARPDLDTGTGRPAPGPVAGNTARTHEPPAARDDGPGEARKPSPANAPAKASPDAPARSAPGSDPRSPNPPTPGKPAARGEPSPHAAPSEDEPPQEGDGHPDMEQGPQDDQETGEDTDKDPAGDAEGRDPQGPQAGNDEPKGENSEDGTAQPGEETTPDDSEPEEPGADEDAETADPGNSSLEASEDPGSEDPESEPPQETTTAE